MSFSKKYLSCEKQQQTPSSVYAREKADVEVVMWLFRTVHSVSNILRSFVAEFQFVTFVIAEILRKSRGTTFWRTLRRTSCELRKTSRS